MRDFSGSVRYTIRRPVIHDTVQGTGMLVHDRRKRTGPPLALFVQFQRQNTWTASLVYRMGLVLEI